MPIVYANARFRINRAPKAPLSAIDEFQVGTVAPAFVSVHQPPALPKYRLRNKALVDASRRSTVVPPRPEINQLNAALFPFATLTAITPNDIAATPYTPSHVPPSPNQAGTVVELSKHRPIAEHVGATRRKYPTPPTGDALLKQQAVLTINSLPSLISRLKDDIAGIANARNNISPSPRKKSPKKPRPEKEEEETVEPSPPLDYDLLQELNQLTQQKTQAEGLLLHFDAMSNKRIGSRALEALKADNLVDGSIASVLQRDAHALVTSKIERLQSEIDSLG